ncbi:MAG: DUF615 domain-containing protein [Chromatiaceae bacterium]|jgi:ribosome-associated protein|nr:DUF615 domain-containing protein [Chromatiaceae bacterium]
MSDAEIPDKPSKSARKREAEGLQSLADQMTGLSDKELVRLGVDAALRDALALVRPMRPSSARNRQLKHCVRFMDTDMAALDQVRAYLDNRHSQQVSANREFHVIERWRDRLLDEGDSALEALLDERQGLDRQRVRQLYRDAVREKETGKPAGAARKLFRYLRETLLGAN